MTDLIIVHERRGEPGTRTQMACGVLRFSLLLCPLPLCFTHKQLFFFFLYFAGFAPLFQTGLLSLTCHTDQRRFSPSATLSCATTLRIRKKFPKQTRTSSSTGFPPVLASVYVSSACICVCMSVCFNTRCFGCLLNTHLFFYFSLSTSTSLSLSFFLSFFLS